MAATLPTTDILDWLIRPEEYADRARRIRDILADRGLDALVLFHPIRMAYVSGFYHLSTERPMAIVVSAKTDSIGALVPWLEQDHIGKAIGVTNVRVYPEYPTGGTQHPLLHLRDLMAEMGLTGSGARIGYDSNGYLDINGYDGPTLAEALGDGIATVKARDIVDRMRQVKSPAELRLIETSALWGNLAHRLMQESIALGRNARDIGNEASALASRMMVAALGPGYAPLTAPLGSTPASVSFMAGANTFFPHGLGDAAGLRRGDVLVTYAGTDVGGYQSELERTMIIGEPSDTFVEHFDQMLQLQQAGFDALRVGRTLAEAEEDVSRVYAELGVGDLQRHHSGHGIGLEGHESPFIDKGDDTVIEAGMVFSVEPGLYVPGIAGFRHSDTVVVTETGVTRLTFYPRDLTSMTILV
ncbi:MAG: Xaa-Pro peptidase family protein [Thermomicrobiales bacterium]